MKVIFPYPSVLRLIGYHVTDIDKWDRFGSDEVRVKWLKKMTIEVTLDFGEEDLAEIKLSTQNGYLTVMSEER
jgi:hypothetical protein